MEDILGFILGFAMTLPDYAKVCIPDSPDCLIRSSLVFIIESKHPFWQLKILLLFKDVGASMMAVKDVQSLLSELLQRLQGSHLNSNNSSQMLSNIDVDILCLLLEVEYLSSAGFEICFCCFSFVLISNCH